MMKFRLSIFLLLLTCCPWYSRVEAQYYFGRNKVHYQRFDWKILQTEHFDVFYYPEMKALAEIGAWYAEDTYLELQNKMNHTLPRRVPLIFYSAHSLFQQTNTYPYLVTPGLGGFFEFLKGRVVIPCTGSINRFHKTIRHELVHVFQQSYIERELKDHNQLFTKSVPLWFTEGLAEYWSSVWDTEAEMVMRDMAINGELVPLESMGEIWGTFLMYKEGQAVLRYLSQEYGEDVVLRIFDRFWKSRRFSDAVKTVTGLDYRELSDKWIYSLKKDMYPLLQRNDMPRMASLKMTRNGFYTTPVYFDNDGDPLAVCMGNRDGYSSLYAVSLKDGEKADPALILRGEKTAALESLPLQQSRMNIDAKGRLIFVARQGAADHLFVYDLKNRKMLLDTAIPGLISIYSPAWAPDGYRVVFNGIDLSGQSDLYIYSLLSAEKQRLTADYFDDRDPCWSPDGRFVVFSSDRGSVDSDNAYNLFCYDCSNGEISYLTRGTQKDRQPVWSPQGNWVAFTSDRDGVDNIYILKIDTNTVHKEAVPFTRGNAPVQVTRFITGALYPCWTDSLGLLLSAYEDRGFHIYQLHPEAVTLRREEPNPGEIIKTVGDVKIFPRLAGSEGVSRREYRRKFSLDFAQSQIIQDPIYGTSGGGQIMISDLLGDEAYHFLIYNNARRASDLLDGFNVAVTRLDQSRRLNYALGLFRFAGHYYNLYEGYFYQKRVGGFVSVSYPLNSFERIETVINIRQFEKDRYVDPAIKAFLLSNFISYTYDNSIWGATGPLDGERINVTLGNTTDIAHSNISFTTCMLDLRKYWRLGLRSCYALRLWGQFNIGKEALPFVLGGAWDLRGYDLWSLWGPRLALVSQEIRFPFINALYVGFPFGGLAFRSINGALFLDAGNVWESRLTQLKGSFGFGLRLHLGAGLVLRLDTGKRTDFKRIEPKTFTRFFFGWDF